MQVHLILYSSSSALGLVIDLDLCLERPIGLLGVAIVSSEVVAANSANKGRNCTSALMGSTSPLLALTWPDAAELLILVG